MLMFYLAAKVILTTQEEEKLYFPGLDLGESEDLEIARTMGALPQTDAELKSKYSELITFAKNETQIRQTILKEQINWPADYITNLKLDGLIRISSNPKPDIKLEKKEFLAIREILSIAKLADFSKIEKKHSEKLLTLLHALLKYQKQPAIDEQILTEVLDILRKLSAYPNLNFKDILTDKDLFNRLSNHKKKFFMILLPLTEQLEEQAKFEFIKFCMSIINDLEQDDQLKSLDFIDQTIEESHIGKDSELLDLLKPLLQNAGLRERILATILKLGQIIQDPKKIEGFVGFYLELEHLSDPEKSKILDFIAQKITEDNADQFISTKDNDNSQKIVESKILDTLANVSKADSQKAIQAALVLWKKVEDKQHEREDMQFRFIQDAILNFNIDDQFIDVLAENTPVKSSLHQLKAQISPLLQLPQFNMDRIKLLISLIKKGYNDYYVFDPDGIQRNALNHDALIKAPFADNLIPLIQKAHNLNNEYSRRILEQVGLIAKYIFEKDLLILAEGTPLFDLTKLPLDQLLRDFAQAPLLQPILSNIIVLFIENARQLELESQKNHLQKNKDTLIRRASQRLTHILDLLHTNNISILKQNIRESLRRKNIHFTEETNPDIFQAIQNSLV